jgi:hypothetical protein
MSTGAIKFLSDTFTPRSQAPVFMTSLANEHGNPYITPRKQLTRDVAALEAFVDKWDKPERALYFCVATLQVGARERSKATLAELVLLHLDLDFKNIAEDPADIEAALSEAQLPPNRIVRSGHGLHAYWWFTDPLEASEANIARVEYLLRRLVIRFAGDPAVAECARLMRLPGSHNSKNGDWIEVTVTEARYDHAYSLEQLETWLVDAEPVLTRKVNATARDDPFASFAAQGPGAPVDVEARLAAMAYHGVGETAVHPTQVSCTAALLSRGLPLEDVVAKVLAATQNMADRVGLRWDWRREEMELRRMCESWLRKHPDIAAFFYAADEDDVAGAGAAPPPPPPASPTRPAPLPTGPLRLTDFYALASTHTYLYVPTHDLWPMASINSMLNRVPVVDATRQPMLDKYGKRKTVTPARWLDRNRRITQLTWAPGSPQIIRDHVVAEAGWISEAGACVFNLYRPPMLPQGDAGKAEPWIRHVRKVYPADANHIIPWFAQRVQRPGEKINHGLVLAGAPGIGKDTMLEPVRQAIGSWNVEEISPALLTGSFNGFARSVILRISEAHDLGDLNRFQFYERLKIYEAAPPHTLRINEKYRPEYYIFNVCSVVITTNYRTESLYLPADDRRHYVAWSDLNETDFSAGYWRDLWRWYATEATLTSRLISPPMS